MRQHLISVTWTDGSYQRFVQAGVDARHAAGTALDDMERRGLLRPRAHFRIAVVLLDEFVDPQARPPLATLH